MASILAPYLGTEPAFPVFPHTKTSLAARTNSLASAQLRSPSSHSSVPLVGVEGQAYDFHGKLVEAYQLLSSEECEEAKGLFQEIHAHIFDAELGNDSLISAHCYIGIAYSLPVGPEREEAAKNALLALTGVDLNTRHWNTLSPEQKSSAFLEFRACCKKMLPLIPERDRKNIQVVQEKIAAFTKWITPLDEFNERLGEADRFAEKKELSKARGLYEQALHVIENERGPIFMIAHAACALKYASTFSRRNTERGELLQTAEDLLSRLYESKNKLIIDLSSTKEDAFATLIKLLTQLHALMPEEPLVARQMVRGRIEFCKAALPNLGEEEPKDFSPRRRRVSSGFPDRTAGPIAIFARFLILGLAVVGVVALVRRFIIRAN